VKKILVTGASGFCGRHLARYLSRKGMKVVGIVHRPDRSNHLLGFPVAVVDLRDAQAVKELIATERPDSVYHLAAQTIPQLSWENESQTLETNVAGTIYLLDALRIYRPQARMLFASTSQVYGRTFRRIRQVKEGALLQPETPYAGSKALAELACRDYHQRFGLDIVMARAFNHLGEGQTGPFVFAQWCRQIARAEAGLGPAVLRVGNLRVQREFLHVDDVVEAYYIIASKASAGSIYNVCQERSYSLEECLSYLLGRSRVKLAVDVRKELKRFNEMPHVGGSASELQRLGWQPQKNVFQALDDLLDYWRLLVFSEQRKYSYV
jgi:GDP-4-dehydro-6-deoxy-D-mannose reductase